ncbi:hypothetical protein Amuc02_20450 [Akkermansia muciniphila]|nr:hypothetical protein Amuc02_20450 [Akkermansia muciniphila]
MSPEIPGRFRASFNGMHDERTGSGTAGNGQSHKNRPERGNGTVRRTPDDKETRKVAPCPDA